MALDYLKSKGHRQIAFIMMDCKQPEDSIDVQERQTVYKKWMQKHNPDIQNIICSLPTPDDTDKSKIQILKKVIQQGITAFLAPGEGGSALLYHHLKELNVKVPDDVSILGMEHNGISFALSPAETTIGQNWKEIVSSAFDTLEKIQQKLPVQDLSIPFRLNERNSVADINQKE